MKKLLVASLFAAAFSVACSSQPVETESNPVPDAHTAEMALDWNGTYEGVLPCASCEGIKTTLTLNNDKTYLLNEVYLTNKPGQNNFNTTGKFECDAQQASLIRLDEKADKRVFFVGENMLEARDAETGKAIEGNMNYILNKK